MSSERVKSPPKHLPNPVLVLTLPILLKFVFSLLIIFLHFSPSEFTIHVENKRHAKVFSWYHV